MQSTKKKKNCSKNKINQANNNSSLLEIILPSFYDYFNPIGVKQSTKTSFENLLRCVRSFGWACVMEEGLIGITDLTTPSITLIAKCGLIDGVNILPKIGNDDAYQKSRKMIYTPYSTSPHIHIPTVCNNWYRPKTVYIFKNWCYFPRLIFFSRMRLLRFFSDIRINMQETVDLNFTSTFFLLPTFALILLSSSSFYSSTLWMHEGFNSDLFMFFASNGQKVTFVHQNIIQPLKNSWNHYILGTWPPLSSLNYLKNVSKSLFV